MEDIPNKVQTTMGIIVDVNLLRKEGKEYLEITVDAVKADVPDQESFDIFRREAIRSGRMSKEDVEMSNERL